VTFSRARLRKAFVWMGLVTLAAACSTAPKREILDLELSASAAPPEGPAILVTEIVDSREFLVSDPIGGGASPHQLAAGGAEDPAITARAIAQIRDARGRPRIDLLLPEGRSVADLTRQALANGFRSAGFRVLAPNDPEAATATPIRAEILRFWSWNTGSWTFTFHFEADIVLRGALAPFEPERKVEGRTTLHSAVGATPGAFSNTTTKGLEDFAAKLADAIAPAR
jgi:hypothetical protein